MSFQTALTCLSASESRIRLFCSELDPTIGPCLRPGHVIEVTGEAGSGKTQFALQVSVCAASGQKKDGIVIYIQTEGEGPFPSARLNEIIENSPISGRHVSDKIFVQAVKDSEELLLTLDKRLASISSAHPINLIVLDSVAGAFRSETETFDRKTRSRLIHQIGYELNLAARKFESPVLVINQVTACIDQIQESFGRSVVPCFGLAFSTYVHTRIFVQKAGEVSQKGSGGPTNDKVVRLRFFDVDFSPILPPKKVYFVVQAGGIRGVKIN